MHIDVAKLFRQGVSKETLINMVLNEEKRETEKNKISLREVKYKAQNYVETELYRDAMRINSM